MAARDVSSSNRTTVRGLRSSQRWCDSNGTGPLVVHPPLGTKHLVCTSRSQSLDSDGAQSSDHPGWRIVFAILQGQRGEWLRTSVFLVLILGALVALALALVAGPWVPSVISAVGALTAGGTTIARTRRGRRQPD